MEDQSVASACRDRLYRIQPLKRFRSSPSMGRTLRPNTGDEHGLMFQDPLSHSYDAIIVGSGATGGWAAKRLSEAGLDVAVLEAGRNVSPKEFTEHKPPFELKYRDIAGSGEWRKSRPIQTPVLCMHGIQLRLVCRRSQESLQHSSRQAVQLAKASDRGRQDTLLGTAELSPERPRLQGGQSRWLWARLASGLQRHGSFLRYRREYVGISGSAEGNDALPDGRFLPPMKMTCGEMHFRERVAAQFGRTVTIGRAAMLTQNHNGRAACHYCGTCERGCITYSYFSSPFTTLKDALKTGKCTLLTNAVVAHVNMDPQSNTATGVTFVDGLTRQTKTLRAKVCDPMCPSARIDANLAELIHQSPLGWLGQLERASRSRIDGPFDRRGCDWRVAAIQGCPRHI